jgi:hypothetical protein
MINFKKQGDLHDKVALCVFSCFAGQRHLPGASGTCGIGGARGG